MSKQIAELKSMHNKPNTHTLPCRFNSDYYAYLQNLSYRTGLDMVQLIRLLIHLSPWNQEFNLIIDRYIKADKRNIVITHAWDEDEDLWRWSR